MLLRTDRPKKKSLPIACILLIDQSNPNLTLRKGTCGAFNS